LVDLVGLQGLAAIAQGLEVVSLPRATGPRANRRAKADRASKRVVPLNFINRSNLRRNAAGMSER